MKYVKYVVVLVLVAAGALYANGKIPATDGVPAQVGWIVVVVGLILLAVLWRGSGGGTSHASGHHDRFGGDA